ncbi:MAG: Na+:solute symporter [Marinilabiliales bacterium]
MALIDWIIIIIYLLISIAVGIFFSKKAGKDTSSFFLSGRNLPWYIAGTSMVATTFAADTPLAVTELVADNGIAGNWLWWNMVFGGMLTVFFFARLWRRAGILTDCEFISIRYSGKKADFLRGFRAVYIGVIMNAVVIAWVNLAMVKILQVIFPDFTIFGRTEFLILGINFSSHLILVAGIMLFVALYTSLSGLMGVSITDTFQFVLAMTGCIILAVFALDHPDVNGISGLKAKLPSWIIEFVPRIKDSQDAISGTFQMTVLAFVTYIGVQWWASWYPGAEPGGGGYVAQRMMSAKNEKHSLLATLWYQIAHFAIRPWPWIIVALVSLVLYPDLPPDNKGAGFVFIIKDIMPSGLFGLLIAAFLAAYMSTIASQTVWGTSYIVNDLVKPYIKKTDNEKYYVRISRITTFLLIIFSLIITTQFNKITDAWKFILICSSGIGPVLILRWFWWRINAWSEITAMIAPYFLFPLLYFYFNWDVYDKDLPVTIISLVAWSTFCWLIVTLLTKPTDENKLLKFYTKIHPGTRGWKKIAEKLPAIRSDKGYGYLFINWFMGCLMIISGLFSFGKIIFGEYLTGIIYIFVTMICGFVIYYNMSKIGWKKVN